MSATIYAFPARGRFAASSVHAAGSSSDQNAPVQVADVRAWYHQEAIEREQNRKTQN